MRHCERCKEGKVVQVIAEPDGNGPLALCSTCLESTFLVRFIAVPQNTCATCGKAIDDHPTVQGCHL